MRYSNCIFLLSVFGWLIRILMGLPTMWLRLLQGYAFLWFLPPKRSNKAKYQKEWRVNPSISNAIFPKFSGESRPHPFWDLPPSILFARLFCLGSGSWTINHQWYHPHSIPGFYPVIHFRYFGKRIRVLSKPRVHKPLLYFPTYVKVCPIIANEHRSQMGTFSPFLHLLHMCRNLILMSLLTFLPSNKSHSCLFQKLVVYRIFPSSASSSASTSCIIFIILLIWSNCFSSWFTCWPRCHFRTIRFLSAVTVNDGRCGTLNGVMEWMMASMCLKASSSISIPFRAFSRHQGSYQSDLSCCPFSPVGFASKIIKSKLVLAIFFQFSSLFIELFWALPQGNYVAIPKIPSAILAGWKTSMASIFSSTDKL